LWKTVLIATAFNLLFEYSMRGINHLRTQPFLPLVLFTTYFTLFAMIEDLIARYRLRDYHLIVIAFSYGILYQCLVSGAAFAPPLILGINWTSVLFVILVWWGALQNVMTFYLANRLTPRDWNRNGLSWKAWVVLLLLNGLMVLAFQRSGQIPQGTTLGIVIMFLILIGSIIWFWKILPSKEERSRITEFRKDRLMDCLSAVTIIIFFVCACFLTFDPVKYVASNVNQTSTRIVVNWSVILALTMTFYRMHSKNPISV
jgi:hypothetical protein